MRIKPLLLIAILLCAVTGVAAHNHGEHCDRKEALLCPVCMVLAKQAAVVLLLVLLFPMITCPGRIAARAGGPHSSLHTRTIRIRAPPA